MRQEGYFSDRVACAAFPLPVTSRPFRRNPKARLTAKIRRRVSHLWPEWKSWRQISLYKEQPETASEASRAQALRTVHFTVYLLRENRPCNPPRCECGFAAPSVWLY